MIKLANSVITDYLYYTVHKTFKMRHRPKYERSWCNAFNLTITAIKQTAELLKVCTEHYVTSNRIECGQQFDRMHSDSSASYLHSERGAGTASCLERNGAGQQYWCKAFTYLRHKEKQRRHLLHTTNTLQPFTLTDQLPRVLQYSAHCVHMRIQTQVHSQTGQSNYFILFPIHC